MLTSRAAIAGAALTALLLTITPVAAWAQGGTGGVDCSAHDPRPGCIVTAGTPGGDAGTSSGHVGTEVCHAGDGTAIPCHTKDGSAGPDGCYYRLATATDGADPNATTGPDGPGRWYVKTCRDNPNLSSQTLVFLPTPPVASPQVLAQQARSMLHLPRVLMALNPARDQLVGLPTWLSVGAASWEPQSATASVAGVSVTATATPVRAAWQMGDGSTVLCAGPGTPWRPGLDPAAASPDCGHRYTRSSTDQPGAAFTVTVQITWTVTWAGAGAAGTVTGLVTVATVALRVLEAPGVITT